MVEQRTDRLLFRRYPAGPQPQVRNWGPPPSPPAPARRGPHGGKGLRYAAIAIAAVIVAAIALSWATSRAPKPVGRVANPVAGAKVSSEVLDLTTGKTLLDTADGQAFRADSLVKLLIAVDLLDRGFIGAAKPSPRVTRMLAYSDDVIASQLWESGGGVAIVARSVDKLGLTGTTAPADRGRWGDTTMTAADVVRVYQHILALPAADRDFLLRPLRDAPEISADGFDQHYGIPAGLAGLPWAIKQGWAAGRGSVEAHTTGLVGAGDRYLVVLLAGYPDGTDLQTAAQATTSSAAALLPLFAKATAR
jgi:hypothetical protein